MDRISVAVFAGSVQARGGSCPPPVIAPISASPERSSGGSRSMSKLIVAGAAFALGLLVAGANGETLALPDNLAGFSTRDGESYFAESDAREAYFPLASNFLTQKTQAYCGVASIVMVLNALGVPAPAVPEYAPYRTFTQDNVLNEQTDAVLPRDVLARRGMTLDQIGGHPRHRAGQGGSPSRLGQLGRRVPQAGKLVSRRARPFRDRQLPAQGDRTSKPAAISRRSPPMTQNPTASSSLTSRATSTRRSG